MKSSYRKAEKYIESEKERVKVARLSKDPARARLETNLMTAADKVKKAGLNG